MAMGCDGEEVAEGWREEGGKLGFGEKFEERGFVVIES